MSNRDYQIETPRPAQRLEALRLVFRDLSEEDRDAEIREHTGASDNATQNVARRQSEILLAGFQRKQIVGAALACLQSGRTAVVWPPRLLDGQPLRLADKLLEAVCRQLARRSVCMANVILPTVAEPDDAVLRRGGFEPLVKLLYLYCPLEEFPAAAAATRDADERLDFEPYRRANHERLVKVVERTYEGTLDCPRLGHQRCVEDVLAGYRDTGQFCPDGWFIVRHRGVRHCDEDVGCLILADHAEHESMELVYMGITAPARGRGWGKEIAQYAKRWAAAHKRSRLLLAVDADNRPAIDMYVSLGFRNWENRLVYAKFFSGSGKAD